MLPEEIKNFIRVFSALPSIGIRQATRLAFKLISSGKASIDETAKAISDLRYLTICANCFFVHHNPAQSKGLDGTSQENLCDICRNPQRNPKIIAIIEKETDLISIEKTGKFKGHYLVLGELAKTGTIENIQKLRLNHLKNRTKKELGQADEIIIALNPTTYGDLNASVIEKELAGFAKKITRLGRGIPSGGEIEFADDETLRSALERRS